MLGLTLCVLSKIVKTTGRCSVVRCPMLTPKGIARYLHQTLQMGPEDASLIGKDQPFTKLNVDGI